MIVRVKLYGILRDAIGANEVCLTVKENSTIGDLLEEMRVKYGAKIYQLRNRPAPVVMLNQKNIKLLDDLNTLLSNDDTVSFVPVVAGG